MDLPTSGHLARDLVLVLPSGASLLVTGKSAWSWIEPPPAAPPSATPALELRGLVGADSWLRQAISLTSVRVVLWTPWGDNLGEASVTWLGSAAVGLRLSPGPFDLRAYLSTPPRPCSVPLTDDELTALRQATRDDDPTDLIPRLLATVAAERDGRLAPGVVRVAQPGERVIVEVANGSAVTGTFMAWSPGGGAGGTTRPRGTMG